LLLFHRRTFFSSSHERARNAVSSILSRGEVGSNELTFQM
jgi:hypothetical protein